MVGDKVDALGISLFMTKLGGAINLYILFISEDPNFLFSLEKLNCLRERNDISISCHNWKLSESKINLEIGTHMKILTNNKNIKNLKIQLDFSNHLSEKTVVFLYSKFN